MANSKLVKESEKIIRIYCAEGRIHEITPGENGELVLNDFLAPKKEEKKDQPEKKKSKGDLESFLFGGKKEADDGQD